MKKGYFGDFGGQFVPELLMPPLLELEEALENIVATEEFHDELTAILQDYVGRPSPITLCKNLSAQIFGSSGKTSTIRAPTRSTTPSDRPC
jgi:tryptophan synthase beta chain